MTCLDSLETNLHSFEFHMRNMNGAQGCQFPVLTEVHDDFALLSKQDNIFVYIGGLGVTDV